MLSLTWLRSVVLLAASQAFSVLLSCECPRVNHRSGKRVVSVARTLLIEVPVGIVYGSLGL